VSIMNWDKMKVAEKHEIVRYLRKSGMSARRIAEETGYTELYVHNLLRAYNTRPLVPVDWNEVSIPYEWRKE